jgi:hypothetical protein
VPQAKTSWVLGEKAAGEALFQGFFLEAALAATGFWPKSRGLQSGEMISA